MTLNDLLQAKKIDPKQVVVMRHRPRETKFNKVLPWLAAEKPELFNAYQQAQDLKVERVIQKVGYIASFIGRSAGKALFVGLYKVDGWKSMTVGECNQLAVMKKLIELGMTPSQNVENKVLFFNLTLVEDFYSNWKGRLIVSWPPPERSWWRRAHRNEMSVLAVREDSILDAAMPAWNEITLSWEELAVLPSRWQTIMTQWRGIYYIFDTSDGKDGKAYVGSAYGSENILGRWRNYAEIGHGGNVLLKNRDPKRFQFSILQLVAQDLDPTEVIRLESAWKKRLHTRKPYGLNDN